MGVGWSNQLGGKAGLVTEWMRYRCERVYGGAEIWGSKE